MEQCTFLKTDRLQEDIELCNEFRDKTSTKRKKRKKETAENKHEKVEVKTAEEKHEYVREMMFYL